MAKGKRRKKKLPVQKQIKQNLKGDTFSSRLQESFRQKRVPKTLIYNYHTGAFHYFHDRIKHLLTHSNKYRKEFWSSVGNSTFASNDALNQLKSYKVFLDDKFKKIISPYSIGYWLHVSRRILPNTMGEDKRPETIMVCRNIVNAAIQKYAQLGNCGNLRMSDKVEIGEIFNGLFLKPEFAQELKNFESAPPQLVLTNFDETSLLNYYELEILAYEMWLVGAKSRTTAKGAKLVVDLSEPKILLDDRSEELAWLILNYDTRMNTMEASATGTVFSLPDIETPGNVLLPTVFAHREGGKYSDPITELLNLEFLGGYFPNFTFHMIDIRTYLLVHMEFAADFQNKWHTSLEYVIAVLTDLALSLTYEILIDKDLRVGANVMFRAYRLFDLAEFKEGLLNNWDTTTAHLGIDLIKDQAEIEKAISFLTLNEVNRQDIYLDSFGPLKVFIPVGTEQVMIDHSVIGEIIYNLFAGLPLKDRQFKGELLERALKVNPSYLPTTESKGLDGSSKQVDFSVAKGDILILAECKAVARSFGIFAGQPEALKHRLRNVISKGLDDVDSKVEWFVKHQKGTNYDLSQFKYIVGLTISPFLEFIHSREDRFWLNENLPRVLSIKEFEELIASDLQQTITKNLVSLVSTA